MIETDCDAADALPSGACQRRDLEPRPGDFSQLCAARAQAWYHPSFHQFSVLQRAVGRLCDLAESTLNSELTGGESTAERPPLAPLRDAVLSLRPPSLRRPRRESELLTVLQQLVSALETAWRQTAAAGASWRRLRTEGLLRSRQRATWGRMEAALPALHRLTAGVVRMVARETAARTADGDGDGDDQAARRSIARWVPQSPVVAA